MLWRLPASLSLPLSARCLPLSSYRSFSSSARASHGLKILFCGSDEFSITALRALTAAKHHEPDLIESIHVVHRPAKLAGRGPKQLRQVPIQQVAEELKLPTSALDSFAGWTPQTPIHLVVAVSFGLLIPSHVLSQARFGGLNVHPSLLPDLPGPAPIQHAILKQRQSTGVSVQTLDSKCFDQGTVLAQTPAPGIPIASAMTADDLGAQLATHAADLLVHVLTTRKFEPPLAEQGWYKHSNGPTDHAPKITQQDRFIDLQSTLLGHLLLVQRALGDPWCLLPDGTRLILHSVVDSGLVDQTHGTPGIWTGAGINYPLIRDAQGNVGIILHSTTAGGKRGSGNAALLSKSPKDKFLEDQAVVDQINTKIPTLT